MCVNQVIPLAVLHNILTNHLLDVLPVDLGVEEELSLHLGVLRLDEGLLGLLGLRGTGEVGILPEGMRALYWDLLLLLSLVYDHKLEERSRQPKGVHYPSSELGM